MLGIRADGEVSLRLHEERHAEELFRLVDENRAYLRPWLPWVDANKSPQDTREFIRQMLVRLSDGREYGFGSLYRGTLVGAVGLDVAKQTREAEVGYWLSEDAQGRGIVSRATQALVHFSFEDLGLNVVVIKCAEDNVTSRRSLNGSASPWRRRFASGKSAARTRSSTRFSGPSGNDHERVASSRLEDAY